MTEPAPLMSPDHREGPAGTTEPAADLPASDAPASDLRAAVQAAHVRRPADAPPPQFSDDGGASVSDRWGRLARLQPLGGRTRITLADEDRVVAEGEVDTAGLIERLGGSDPVYDLLASVLDEENGPGTRSG